MSERTRILSIVLFGLALFCAAGYKQAGKPGYHPAWRVVYLSVGATSMLAGALVEATSKHKKTE
jgi:hypothetical protein